MRNPRLISLGITSVLLTMVIAWPVVLEPTTRIFGAETVGRHLDPFAAMYRFAHPDVRDLYWQPATDVPGAWLARAAGPVAAYNIVVLASLPLTALATYALATFLGIGPIGAAVAALAFAFGPVHLAHAAYHPHIAQLQWIPFALLCWWRYLAERTRVRAFSAAGAIAGLVLSNYYGLLYALALFPAATIAWACRDAMATSLRRQLIGGSVTGVASVLLALSTVTTVLAMSDARLVTDYENAWEHSATLLGFVAPPVDHAWLGAWSRGLFAQSGVTNGLLEQQLTPGLGLWLLALLAWRDRQQRWLTGTAWALATLAAVMAMGPWLHPVLPMFRSVARLGILTSLMVALLAGVAVSRLWHDGRRASRVILAGALALAVLELAPLPWRWRPVMPSSAHARVVATPGATAVECKAPGPASALDGWLAGGRVLQLAEGMRACAEPHLADALAVRGVTHVIMGAPTAGPAPWGHDPRLPLSRRFADSALYTVSAAPGVVTTAWQGFYERENDGHATWRWMGSVGEWRVENATGIALSASLDIEWAAFAVMRRVRVVVNDVGLDTLAVPLESGWSTIEGIQLTPGTNTLRFHSVDGAARPAPPGSAGDTRSLSVQISLWRWRW